jgi:mercuric ion transport protein
MKVSTTGARRSGLLNYLSLFTSLSTLLCCALPSLLVLLGLGATVASVLSSVPWLVSLSRHKAWTFLISGTLIALSFLSTYYLAPKLRKRACEADDPGACEEASKLSRVLLWVSAAIYAFGFFVAFVLGPILARLDS